MIPQHTSLSAATLAGRSAHETTPLDTTRPDTALLDTALLDWADPDPDTRVVLIGSHMLEMMCALIRRGSVQVITLRPADRPEPACADLALIADLAAESDLEAAIAHASRALVPLGSLVLGLPAGLLTTAGATRLLWQHGFARIRSRALDGDLLIRAELPLHGHVSCA